MKIVMLQKKSGKPKAIRGEAYDLNQCALYKCGSLKRLAVLLKVDVATLNLLLNSDDNYRHFEVVVDKNPFSGKAPKKRQVQEPKPLLRKLHVRILSLLQKVSIPVYVHGAVKGRSYQTNAAVHKLSQRAATFDLKGFYGSTKYHRVHDFFHRVLLCPTDIAGKLARLTTCDCVMPTGSPLSPLLSFWVAKGMFDEMYGVSVQYNLSFTCYVDDLTFSGSHIPNALKRQVEIVAGRFGYELSLGKTRIFKIGQPVHVTGVVLHRNVLQAPYSRLMAARKIVDAIDGVGPDFGFSETELVRKLAGLAAEVATIDQRFARWADHARQTMILHDSPSPSADPLHQKRNWDDRVHQLPIIKD